MSKYTVEITETMTKKVEVEAESADEARRKAQGMWNNFEIEMDGDYDYYDVDFWVDEE